MVSLALPDRVRRPRCRAFASVPLPALNIASPVPIQTLVVGTRIARHVLH